MTTNDLAALLARSLAAATAATLAAATAATPDAATAATPDAATALGRVADELRVYQASLDAREQIRRRLQALLDRHAREAEREADACERELEAIRATCTHPLTETHQGDERGDSYRECRVCGSELV